MSGFVWGSSEEKIREWNFAKEKLTQNGNLLPDGTKLRRNDYPKDLNHSFMVMDGQIIAISGKGLYLGSGLNGSAKLAEDETGRLLALKIITNDDSSDSARESDY